MEPKNNQEHEPANDQPAEMHHHTYLEGENPNPDHEFPSVGHVKTDFVSRDHGRTSHRMIDHEPGSF